MDRSSTSGMSPNILLVTTDTQRCDTLRCMGNPHAVSPNLDRLAAEGTRFTDAYTTCPMCVPARSSLVTGVHAHVHGAIENGIEPHDHLVTYPSLLQDAGYTTILVGKQPGNALHPQHDIECKVVGEKGSGAPDPYTRFLADHGYDRGTVSLASLPAELHIESFLVDEMISRIDDVTEKSDRPFYAHCSLLSPHDPIDPPAPWDTLFDDIELPDVNYRPGELATQPALLRDVFGLHDRTPSEIFQHDGVTLNMEAVDARRRRYHGLASFCDFQIGRLLDHLDQRGLRERTLVIVSTDHGTQLFDHGFDDKHCFFDAAWRVPLILSMPGTVPQGMQRQFASWADIAPTILAAAGLECDTMQGLDLLTPLTTARETPRHGVPATLYTSSALVTRHWKIEWYPEESTGRLYHRDTDPKEQVNLFDSDEHASIRDQLLHALLEWKGATIDVQWLKAHTRLAGPVARNVARHTGTLRGDDAERRLNDRIATLDPAQVVA